MAFLGFKLVNGFFIELLGKTKKQALFLCEPRIKRHLFPVIYLFKPVIHILSRPFPPVSAEVKPTNVLPSICFNVGCTKKFWGNNYFSIIAALETKGQ
jgi:hypothetical protein